MYQNIIFSKTRFFLLIVGLFISLFTLSGQNCTADFIYTIDGNVIKLTGKSTAGDSAKYYWTFGNGSSAEGIEVKYAYPKSGEYQICLKVLKPSTNAKDSACIQSACKKIVILPVTTNKCELKVEIQNKVVDNIGYFYAVSNNPAAKYTWFVSGQTQLYEGKEIKIPFEKNGVYEVCVKAYTSDSCRVQACKRIEIAGVLCKIEADFSYTIDSNNVVRVLGKSTAGDSVKYYWTFGNGKVAEGREAKIQYEKPGAYEICMKVVKVSNCAVVICKKIVVHPVTTNKCELKVEIQNKVVDNIGYFYAVSNNPAAKYTWFVSGQTQLYEGKEIKIPFEKNGVYEVCVKAYTSDSCRVQACKRIEIAGVLCKIEADFSYTIDSNNVVRVLGKSTAGDSVKYYWTFGNGKVAEGREAKIQYEKPGAYEICMKVVKVSNCAVVICKKIVVHPVTTNKCELKVEIQNKVVDNIGYFYAVSNNPAAKYTWFVSGQTQLYEGKEIKIPFEKNGVYEVCVKTYTSDSCRVQACKRIEIAGVLCKIEADFSYTIDSNNVVRVLGKSTAGDSVKYYWTFGNGKVAEGREAKIQYEKPGAYEICMKVVKGTCFTTICKKIEIRNLCNLGADFTFSIENNIVKVLAKTIISDSVKYYWYFSNGISLEGREATFKYDKPGTYQMCLKVVRGSLISSAVQPCIQTVCKQIVINNAASCNLKPDFTYKIDGNTLQLAGKSGDPKAKYYWYSKELKLDTTGQEIKVSYSKTGVYQVCLKVINADETCKDYVCKLISAGNRITIFPNPSSDYLNIAVDQEISQLFIYNQLKVEVYAQKGANISPNVDISNLNEGIYTVTLFLSNGETITKRFYKK